MELTPALTPGIKNNIEYKVKTFTEDCEVVELLGCYDTCIFDSKSLPGLSSMKSLCCRLCYGSKIVQ